MKYATAPNAYTSLRASTRSGSVIALRAVADRVTGTLSDALLDPSGSAIVRRRIPRTLERCPTVRAIGALVEGLFDEQPDVRSQCVLALLRVVELDPNAPLPRERIVDAIELELSRDTVHPSGAYFADALDVQGQFGEERVRALAKPRVEQVMTLLALVLEREPVRLAYHALYGDDPAIRGTALEYLDNVLPERVKSGVLSLFEGSPARASRRPRRDLPSLIDELLRSHERAVPSR
jgi:ATP:ADP antiporter, AAA family